MCGVFNIVMNPREMLLTIGETIGFSRSTLLHGVSYKSSWLMRLHAGISPRKTQFNPRTIDMASVVGKWY
jgi:hypothetical protein